MTCILELLEMGKFEHAGKFASEVHDDPKMFRGLEDILTYILIAFLRILIRRKTIFWLHYHSSWYGCT